MELLLIRFDAPLMSFGNVVVDQHNGTDLFPYRSMLTGLLANALGFTRGETDAHTRLQSRIRYAARRDRSGTVIVDYQTVDFDADGPMASELGWTTSGALELRKGGGAGEATHIRYRHYLADAVVTVALGLEPEGEAPTIATIEESLKHPARPLFIGRKCCVPSLPVLITRMDAAAPIDALREAPRAARAMPGPLPALWQASNDEDPERTLATPRVEDKDWLNSIHVGRHFYVEGLVTPTEGEP